MAASERTQLVVTTHSDTLVDALTAQPESVIVCEKHDGESQFQRLERRPVEGVAGKVYAWPIVEHGRNRGQPMVTARLYVEGAGPWRAQQTQCRRAFAKFFESAGVKNRPGGGAVRGTAGGF